MIRVETPAGLAIVLEHASELPDPPERIERLYMDCETRAPTPDGEGLSPYEGALVCGWAATWDDQPAAFYAPTRHADARWNLPVENVARWTQDVLRRSRTWVNHNVKFDAHFAIADKLELPDSLRLVCTLTRAKMVDSDRMGFGLKDLSREWLSIPPDEADAVGAWLAGVKLPRRKKCHDFSQVPADLLGRYACGDVLRNRRLDRWLRERREPDQARLWETETKLTRVLLDMELEGLLIDQRANQVEKLRCVRAMVDACERLRELTGVELVDSNECFHEVLVNQLGLPVLERTDPSARHPSGQPSFEADVMVLYAGMPRVLTDPRATEVVELMLKYRTESRFLSLYCESFERFLDEHGRIHPSYNQLVRTGRMSSSRPNGQQQNERSKALVLPAAGEAFVCSDASQVEFRTMSHYIQDARTIEAYARDPKTDFHQWVADLVGVDRSPAKTLNFAMGYGAGRRRVTATLMSDKALVRETERLLDEVPEESDLRQMPRTEAVERMVALRANALYEAYHAAIPGLRVTSERAAALCRSRGYIKNAYGRRRHLPARFAHKAFNSLNQGCAMDFIKERMVALSPRFNEESRRAGLRLNANVHDEVLASAPRDWVMGEEAVPLVEGVLSRPSVTFRVPLVWNTGRSEKNWAEAKA